MITKFRNLDDFFAFIDTKREEIEREYFEKSACCADSMTTTEQLVQNESEDVEIVNKKRAIPDDKANNEDLIENLSQSSMKLSQISLTNDLKTQNLIQLAWSTSMETPHKGEATDTTMIMEQLTLRESELDAFDDIIEYESEVIEAMGFEAETTAVDPLGLDALPFPLSQFPVEETQSDSDSILDLDLEDDDLDFGLFDNEGITGEEADDDHDYDFDISMSQISSTQAAFQEEEKNPVGFVGFKTGKGQALPAPSKEALKRARSLIEIEEESDVEVGRRADSFTIGFTTGNGKALKPPSEEAVKRAKSIIEDVDNLKDNIYQNQQETQENISAFPSFSTAKGKALPPPSEEALKKAKFLIEKDEAVIEEHKNEASAVSFPSFSTAKGKSIPPPSKEALEKANNLIESVKVVDGSIGFSTGRGKAVPPPSEEAMKRAAQLIFDENDKENIMDKNENRSITANNGKDKIITNTKSVESKRPLVPGNTAFKPPSRIDQKGGATPSSIPTKHFSLSTAWRNPRPRPKPVIKKLFDFPAAVAERYKLRDFFKKKTPDLSLSLQDYAKYDIDERVLRMTSGKANRFEFDNGWGYAEAHKFLLSLGAQSASISLEWTANHFRWIVWKFCSMIRTFPEEYSPANLSREWILQQLCYRYEREVNMCQRSPVKKIIERDDAASKYLCLMVAEIDGSKRAVELTDGWYSIWTSRLDDSIWSLVECKRISSGTKIEIFGASLIGGQDAIPALEASSPDCAACRLFFGRNSCRPARWDTKLGFVFKQEARPVIAFLKHLRQIHPQGGVVPAVRVRIDRVYPLLIREERPGDGGAISRSERDHFASLETRKPEDQLEGSKFTPIQRIRVSAGIENNAKVETSAMITFWKALGEDQRALLQEGSTIIFTNLRAGKSNSFINVDLGLSSTKATAIYKSDIQFPANQSHQPIFLGRFRGFRELKPNELHDVIGVSLGRRGGFYWIGFIEWETKKPYEMTDDESLDNKDDNICHISESSVDSSLICIKNFNCNLAPGEMVTFKDLLFTHYDSREGVAHFSFVDYSDFVKEKKNSSDSFDCTRAQERFKTLLGQ